jgi:hypothetical protein
MTFDDFYHSLTASQPPVELTPALAGLWWDANRKEGDQENAAYWYRRAGKPVCREPFEAQWRRKLSDLVG